MGWAAGSRCQLQEQRRCSDGSRACCQVLKVRGRFAHEPAVSAAATHLLHKCDVQAMCRYKDSTEHELASLCEQCLPALLYWLHLQAVHPARGDAPAPQQHRCWRQPGCIHSQHTDSTSTCSMHQQQQQAAIQPRAAAAADTGQSPGLQAARRACVCICWLPSCRC